MDGHYPLNPDQESGAVAQANTRSPFVGRERELAELLGALEETRAGHGRAVLLGGEPGIGKSRLADELASRAEALGYRVLWGRGWEDAGAPPYWPWVQALRTVIRATPVDQLASQLGYGAADVAQMLPELSAMYPDLSGPANSDAEAARFQLFDSTATFMHNVAAAQPTLIVLDDLHAADTSSILLLRFVASQLSEMAMLILGTYRDLELTPGHPLTAAIAEMARERATRLMMLGGLDSDAVSEYIRSTADVAPDGLTAAAVWRETNGNPLFVGEAVRLLEAEGRLGDIGDLTSLRLAVPAGIQAVITRRIGLLSTNVGEMLTSAAVVGPEFAIDVVRHITAQPAAEFGAAIDEAMEAGLLTPVVGAPGRLRFSHELVRETLYAQLSVADQARLHRAIGESIERTAGLTDSRLAELAFHFGQSNQLVEDDADSPEQTETRRKAIDYARRAGDHAMSSLAYEQARQLYAMAIAAHDRAADADVTLRTELSLALGDADARTGDLDSARLSFRKAADLAREIGSGTMLARAALGYGGRHQWARAGHDTQLVALLRDALERLGSADDMLRARLMTRLAGAQRSDPSKRDECDKLSQQAIDLARAMDDQVTLGFALAGRFWATWWPENPEERERLTDEIQAVADRTGDSERLSEANLMRFLVLFERGSVAEARQQMDELADVVHRMRQPAHLWLVPVTRSELVLFLGDFETAEHLVAGEFKSNYRVTPGRDDLSAATMHLFHLRREQGRLEEVEQPIRDAVREFPWYPMHKAALCCLLAELGRTDEARTVFAELAADDFAVIYRDNEWLLGMSLASHACALLDDSRAASVLYGLLLPYAGRHAIGHVEGSVGMVDTYLGLLAATLLKYDDAEAHLTRSIEALGQQGGRPWRAHAQHELAAVLRRRDGPGDDQRASELDADALRGAEELGMSLASQIRPDAPATVDRARLAREGDYWAVDFGGDSFRVRDSKGMHHLARLLQSPGIELHALDLVLAGGRMPVTNGVHDAELAIGDPSDAGPMLDAAAKAAYRERLRAIEEEIAEAERWNDPERAARIEDERQALVHELAAAVGLGNRDRTSSTSSAERARVSVTRAIRASMGRIGDYSPRLAAHLEATIRTGTYCAYVPDPRAPITWEAS